MQPEKISLFASKMQTSGCCMQDEIIREWAMGAGLARSSRLPDAVHMLAGYRVQTRHWPICAIDDLIDLFDKCTS